MVWTTGRREALDISAFGMSHGGQLLRVTPEWENPILVRAAETNCVARTTLRSKSAHKFEPRHRNAGRGDLDSESAVVADPTVPAPHLHAA